MNHAYLCGAIVLLFVLSTSPAAAEESFLSRTWSSTTAGTKWAFNTTVDVVTLKPVRRQFSAKKPDEFRLGFKPDPRKKAPSKSWFGSMFGSSKTTEPRTVDEFFSLERPK